MAPLALLLIACALLPASAVVVPLGATSISPQQLQMACTGQGMRNVCYPLPTGGRHYIECGQSPMVRSCASGKRFDYVRRRCVQASLAQTCPTWNCPVAPVGPALSPIYGEFGTTGNLTIPLYKGEDFMIICPVDGHCLGGMSVDVHVECPAPPDRTPYTFELDFEETLFNNQLYPKRLPALYAYCGDKIFVEYDEPFHLVQLFNTSAAARALWSGTPVMPYPPQPVYLCPNWPVPPTGMPLAAPLDGEEVIMPGVPGAQVATWIASQAETFFITCPITNHCRQGMVFKVTVEAAPAGYMPVRHNITWVLTSENYEDMTLYVGDSMRFEVPEFPPMAHGVHKTPVRYITAVN